MMPSCIRKGVKIWMLLQRFHSFEHAEKNVVLFSLLYFFLELPSYLVHVFYFALQLLIVTMIKQTLVVMLKRTL